MTSNILQFILTPAIAILTGAAVWFFRSRVDALQRQTERLHSDRVKLYAQVLEPYVLAFSNIGKSQSGEVEALYSSVDYRRAIFELNVAGSDSVIRAMNDFMQYFYTREKQEDKTDKPEQFLLLFGRVLLAIRKDLGKRRTKLSEIDMLQSQITDIGRLKSS